MMMASSSGSDLSTLHSDLFHSHILTRLDGPSLAAASAASSAIRRLCLHDPLWRQISTSTWPSLQDPSLRHVISNFPSSHRSLFLDSHPTIQNYSPPQTNPHPPSPTIPQEFISAVDIYYHDKPIFSKLHRTQTQTSWFNCSPLWIDLLDPKEFVPTPISHVSKDVDLVKHLEENLTLSWIMIDPSRNRAVNLSSHRAVTAKRMWITGDVEVVYAVVLEGPTLGEWVQCNIKVLCSTCGEEEEGGKMHVREVSLTVEDCDGRSMCGEQSLMIMQSAVECGRRKRVDHDEAKARFDAFLELKKHRREVRERNDQAIDMVLIFSVISLFLFFSWFFFF